MGCRVVKGRTYGGNDRNRPSAARKMTTKKQRESEMGLFEIRSEGSRVTEALLCGYNFRGSVLLFLDKSYGYGEACNPKVVAVTP
jgi:hypothetical protein